MNTSSYFIMTGSLIFIDRIIFLENLKVGNRTVKMKNLNRLNTKFSSHVLYIFHSVCADSLYKQVFSS